MGVIDMKNKLKKVLILTFILLAVALIIGFIQQNQAKKQAAETSKKYLLFWCAVPNTNPYDMATQYSDYSAVNEDSLYICIMAYNHCEKKSLSLDEFKDFLSSEKNEDGSLRINSIPDSIQEYMDWYHDHGKNGEIDPYQNSLKDIYYDFRKTLGEAAPSYSRLNRQQLTEIMKKLDDPNYEINSDMWGTQTE